MNALLDLVNELERDIFLELEKASSSAEVENLRIAYLGRKGKLTRILRELSHLSLDERRIVGSRANAVKKRIEEEIAKKLLELKKTSTTSLRLEYKIAQVLDTSLPGKRIPTGKIHPLTKTVHEVANIFIRLGYSVVEGPEAELDYYNFTALNQPPYHPARSSHDTFYLTEETIFDVEISEEDFREKTRKISLLRTHTSPVQIRVMEKQKPPVYIIAPGRCYRKDVPDASHSPVFHQIEGLAVDEGITFTDLKGTLEIFAREFFGSETRVRFRASYFPFTEPSAEVDVSCVICKGSGCRLCKGSGWLEILGAGMVNPAVFEEVNYDSEKYTGFAFGMGVERLTMLKYRIPDMRFFFENDFRFLSQF